ncbi:MAG: hypothetical protein V3S17_02565 [candidate division Zixibacteria bacterium]
MYKIEKQKYGLKLTLSGDMIESEIVELTDDLKLLLGSITGSFSILIDAREMMTMDKSVVHLAAECQRVVKDGGRQHTAFVLNSPILKDQIKRMSVETSSADAIRYIFADKTDEWEKVAMDWLLHGIEPDQELTVSK